MHVAALCLAAAMPLCTSANAVAQSASGEWSFSLTPYLWLPTIEGSSRFGPPPGGGGNPDVSVGPTDWLSLLNFAVMVSGGAKKGPFTVISDVVFLSMSSNDSRVASVDDTISVPGSPVQIPIDASLSLNTKFELHGLEWTLAAGYAIEDTDTTSMDLFAGVRYLGVDVSARWNLATDIVGPGGGMVLPAQGGVGRDTDLWDAIVGVRGHYELSQKWTVPYYFDFGTGSSDLTWQGMVGLTYTFDWGQLMMVYRHLEYDEGSNGLLQDFSFSGPAIGARFSF